MDGQMDIWMDDHVYINEQIDGQMDELWDCMYVFNRYSYLDTHYII